MKNPKPGEVVRVYGPAFKRCMAYGARAVILSTTGCGTLLQVQRENSGDADSITVVHAKQCRRIRRKAKK